MTEAHGTEGKKRISQRFMVCTLVAAVIVVDQTVKWWAWRHFSGVMINSGGDFLTGPTIGRLYADPVTGALLDLVDCGLVSIAATILTRRRRPLAITICGSLMVGGWASNLLDRLGMHYWTAPGSVRGAVDFISAAGRCWNFADVLIIGATPLFLLVTAWQAMRVVKRSVASSERPAIRNARWARVPAVAVAGPALIMTVALGATHHGGLTKPSRPSKPKLPTCAPKSPANRAVSHRDPACTKQPLRIAIRKSMQARRDPSSLTRRQQALAHWARRSGVVMTAAKMRRASPGRIPASRTLGLRHGETSPAVLSWR